MVAATVAEQASDILDLTESMAAEMPAPMPQPSAVASPSPAASQFRTIDASPDVGFDDFADKAAMQPAPQPSDDRGGLLSNSTSAAVDNAFNALAQTVLAQNARTLEDLVREMLRPMLKTWLDDNLPGMVERLVRAEIERVSRGRAG
jgi:cell pole-organizing protein PopZ